MIDIQIIRDTPELVAEKSAQKGYPVDVQAILQLDKQRKEALLVVEELRAKRNEIAGRMKGSKPSESDIAEGKNVKEQLTQLETSLKQTEEDLLVLLKKVVNLFLNHY